MRKTVIENATKNRHRVRLIFNVIYANEAEQKPKDENLLGIVSQSGTSSDDLGKTP